MCLAVPAKVIEVAGEMAAIDVGGVIRRVSALLVPDLVPGDYVITHAGFALHKMDEKDALESLKILQDMVDAVSQQASGE